MWATNIVSQTPTTQKFASGFLVAVILCINSHTTSAATHSGTARIVDGDGLWIDDAEYRLHGIDAVEGNQGCLNANGKLWRCGQEAKKALAAFTSDAIVTCEWEDLDRYGRRIATCYANEIDLAAAMVFTGYAIAYLKYSDKYVSYEIEARKNRSGIWNGTFDMPELHRKHGKKLEIPAPNPSKPIKGNINRKGARYYHCPGDRSYKNTQISEAKGERWFGTSEEAESAGWVRPPKAQACNF